MLQSVFVDPCKARQGPETRVDAEHYAMQNAY